MKKFLVTTYLSDGLNVSMDIEAETIEEVIEHHKKLYRKDLFSKFFPTLVNKTKTSANIIPKDKIQFIDIREITNGEEG